MPMEKLQQRMRRVGQGRGISSVPFSSEREKVRTRKDAVERERAARAGNYARGKRCARRVKSRG